jgi:cytochrome P450
MAVIYDPVLAENVINPFPIFHQLQDEDPIHWNELIGGWVITRYADVMKVLMLTNISSDRITPSMCVLADERQREMKQLWHSLKLWTVFSDPPQHTRLRGLFNKAFTPGAIKSLVSHIQEIADELIANVAAAGEMEVIHDFAYPLPATVIAEMIGIPRRDIRQLKIWSNDIEPFLGAPVKGPEQYQRARESMAEMIDYFAGIIAAHRAAPREDIMSNLISVEEHGDMLSEDELIATCIMLLFAAHATTTHLIGNGILALLSHPEQLQLLREQPALIESAVEEMLRYDGPVQTVRRVAQEDLEIGGKLIKAGQLVFCMLNAANRDGRQFPDPDSFNIRRKDNRHIAFGYGIHFCAGAPLARIEGQIAIGTMVRRLADLKLLPQTQVWNRSFGFRGLESYRVSFQPES